MSPLVGHAWLALRADSKTCRLVLHAVLPDLRANSFAVYYIVTSSGQQLKLLNTSSVIVRNRLFNVISYVNTIPVLLYGIGTSIQPKTIFI